MKETLDTLDRLPPYNELAHKAQIYAHRHQIEAAKHAAEGRCPACQQPVRRLYADFTPVGGLLRGVLCRRCREKARKVTIDPRTGEITWTANSAWFAMVSDYVCDNCVLFWMHARHNDDQPCERCPAEAATWRGLAEYMIVSEGRSKVDYTPACHQWKTPIAAPIFIAPANEPPT